MILGKRDKDLVEALKKDRVDALQKKEKAESQAKENKKDADLWKSRYEEADSKLTEVTTKKNALEEKVYQLMYIDFDKFAEMNDITLKELAKILNVSVSTLTKYRKDPTDMTPDRHKDIMTKLLTYKRTKKRNNSD